MPHLISNAVLIPEIARMLNEGHTVNFTPDGVSMRPFIEGGKDSVILVKPNHLRVGDVVLAQVQNERYVLHRLIRMQGSDVVLMGDGNLQGEEYCTQADVLAQVVEVRSPRGRRKPLTRGRLWRWLLPMRRFLLKIYRHTPRLL